jgi:hypothetical protein
MDRMAAGCRLRKEAWPAIERSVLSVTPFGVLSQPGSRRRRSTCDRYEREAPVDSATVDVAKEPAAIRALGKLVSERPRKIRRAH